jgi:hypothetical protein
MKNQKGSEQLLEIKYYFMTKLLLFYYYNV